MTMKGAKVIVPDHPGQSVLIDSGLGIETFARAAVGRCRIELLAARRPVGVEWVCNSLTSMPSMPTAPPFRSTRRNARSRLAGENTCSHRPSALGGEGSSRFAPTKGSPVCSVGFTCSASPEARKVSLAAMLAFDHELAVAPFV